MADKRKVFAPLDKEIFKEILKKYAHVIENKKTDAVSNKEKEAAWVGIATEFNACTRISEPRAASQLKKLWSNMKSAAREQKTRQRQNTFATGGGPPEYVNLSLIDDMAEVAPHLMTTVIPVVDSDMTYIEQSAAVDRVSDESSEIMVVDQLREIPTEAIIVSPSEEILQPSTATSSSASSSSSHTSKSAPISKRRRISWSDAAHEESNMRTERQILLMQQDKELFEIRKAIAQKDLEASEARLKTEQLKKELMELELMQKKRDLGLEM